MAASKPCLSRPARRATVFMILVYSEAPIENGVMPSLMPYKISSLTPSQTPIGQISSFPSSLNPTSNNSSHSPTEAPASGLINSRSSDAQLTSTPVLALSIIFGTIGFCFCIFLMVIHYYRYYKPNVDLESGEEYDIEVSSSSISVSSSSDTSSTASFQIVNKLGPPRHYSKD